MNVLKLKINVVLLNAWSVKVLLRLLSFICWVRKKIFDQEGLMEGSFKSRIMNLINLHFWDIFSVLKLKPACHNLSLWTNSSVQVLVLILFCFELNICSEETERLRITLILPPHHWHSSCLFLFTLRDGEDWTIGWTTVTSVIRFSLILMLP